MTFEIFFLLLLIGITFAVFLLELIPLEVTTMCLLAVLLLVGFITVDQAVAGLSNKAVVTVGAMFILSHALVKTGILEIATDRLSHRVGQRKWLGVSILLVAGSLLSGFLNNTAVVAIFIPLAIDFCRRFHLSPSKVLIPLSYVSIFGGTLTLIGTSTNLIVSALAEEAGEAPLRMFEFTPLGLIFMLVGLTYVLFFSGRLLPSRSVISSLTRKYQMRAYLTELRLLNTTRLVGKSCRQIEMNRRYDVTVLAVLREGKRYTENIGNMLLQPEDILIVRGAMQNILRLRTEQGMALLSDVKPRDKELSDEGQVIAEGLVTSNSNLIGKTLQQIDFRRHYGAFVLAIRHHEAIRREKIAHIPLQFSDTLLMVAPQDRINELGRSEDVIIISELDLQLRRGRFWWLVMILIPLVVILAALGVMEILKGALLASILLLAVTTISPHESYRAINWSVLFLIAAFIPVGEAMVQTGAARFIASSVLSLIGWFPADIAPQVALSLIYLITSLMTQTISNNAAAIIVVPIALNIALTLGVNPRAFLMAVCFAASAGFMTPIGYQTNMMVYGPGSYRFLDYTRFGAPLNLIFWLLASFLIPLIWPL